MNYKKLQNNVCTEVNEFIVILQRILEVEDVEVKNCALESLIERLEDFKNQMKD